VPISPASRTGKTKWIGRKTRAGGEEPDPAIVDSSKMAADFPAISDRESDCPPETRLRGGPWTRSYEIGAVESGLGVATGPIVGFVILRGGSWLGFVSLVHIDEELAHRRRQARLGFVPPGKFLRGGGQVNSFEYKGLRGVGFVW